MSESRETRLKRLRLRSWRRGIKEMDLILGNFADQEMAKLTDAELDAHESMMAEHDQDLYYWITHPDEIPTEIAPALHKIRSHFLQLSK